MPKFNPLNLKVSNSYDTWLETITLPLNPDAKIVLNMRTISLQQFQAAQSLKDRLIITHGTGNGIDKPIPIPSVDGQPVIISDALALLTATIEVAQDPNFPESERYNAVDLMQLSVDNQVHAQLTAIQNRVFQRSNKSRGVPETDPLSQVQLSGPETSTVHGSRAETEVPMSS